MPCQFDNPLGQTLPAVPLPGAAPSLSPAQGDHLFGDVLGSIETALAGIFGGGANLLTRIRGYNPVLATVWENLGTVDFGHGASALVASRAAGAETDEHALMYGRYSERFAWQFCQIVCRGYADGKECITVSAASKTYRNTVLASFDELLNHLIDRTELENYYRNYRAERAIAAANHHVAISLATALTYTQNTVGHVQGGPKVTAVLARCSTLRAAVDSLLLRFDKTRYFNPDDDTWSS